MQAIAPDTHCARAVVTAGRVDEGTVGRFRVRNPGPRKSLAPAGQRARRCDAAKVVVATSEVGECGFV